MLPVDLIVSSASINPCAHNSGNAAPLEKIVPKRLKYRDIPRAMKTIGDAFKYSDDPIQHYATHVPGGDKTPKWRRQAGGLMSILVVADYVRRKVAWTVENGHSLIVWNHAPSTRPPPTPIDKTFSWILERNMGTYRLLLNKEERKRRQEVTDKIQAGVKKFIGSRSPEVLSLDLLSTAPERQGHGYASALVAIVTSVADEQGRAIWLASSNVAANTGYYNSLGFFTVGTIFLGDENPTWKEQPVPVDIMVREPKDKSILKMEVLV